MDMPKRTRIDICLHYIGAIRLVPIRSPVEQQLDSFRIPGRQFMYARQKAMSSQIKITAVRLRRWQWHYCLDRSQLRKKAGSDYYVVEMSRCTSFSARSLHLQFNCVRSWP